jgi:sec-independent protein translocase protein TatA
MTTGLLNPTHLILLLLVALIILGPKRLPQAGRALGRGMREFRDGITGRDDTMLQTEAETPTPTSTAIPQAQRPTGDTPHAAIAADPATCRDNDAA